jgi:predicted RNA binding protein YcfA (HicA-like mRNA interferase family)
MNRKKLLGKITRGSLNNIPFADIVNLAIGFGFQISRVQGSHHIFKHPKLDVLLNLQEVRGEAKPYQIRQLIRFVERYDLRLESDE